MNATDEARERLVHEARCWLADAGFPADEIADARFSGVGTRVDVPAWLAGDRHDTASLPVVVERIRVTDEGSLGMRVRAAIRCHYAKRMSLDAVKTPWKVGHIRLRSLRPRRHLLPTDPTDAPRIVG